MEISQFSSPRFAVIALAAGLVVSLAPQAGAAQDPNLLYERTGAGGWGQVGAGVGDVNRDGYGDFAVGTARAANSAGQLDLYSGRDGSLLWSVQGPGAGLEVGSQISAIGDVDFDGHADFAVAAGGVFNNGTDAGEVFVISGQTQQLLWSAKGDSKNWYWGWKMAPAGDVNNDGVDDLIVGSDRADLSGISSGVVRVYSGDNGKVLHELVGSTVWTNLGSGVAGAGDVNFDGYDDFIVGAESDDAVSDGRGSATVYSGLDASVLFRFDGVNDFDFLGASVDGGYDANGDGVPDFVVGASYTDVFAERAGSVQVFSGVDGSELWRVDGQFYFNTIGDNAAFAGDMNGDGFDDVMIGDRRGGYDGDINTRGVGYTTIYSGADGSELWRLDGREIADSFGARVSAAGDVNGNGAADIVISAPAASFAGTGLGYVQVYNGPTSPHALFISAPTSLNVGEYYVGWVYGADPLGIVQVFRGTGYGMSHQPAIGGLNIVNPELLSIGTANTNGVYRFGKYVPAQMAGTGIWLQAVDSLGATSNVVFTEAQ